AGAAGTPHARTRPHGPRRLLHHPGARGAQTGAGSPPARPPAGAPREDTRTQTRSVKSVHY
ncbi:hypothetical protein BMUNKI379_04745, partial [Burkholderia multivorans]